MSRLIAVTGGAGFIGSNLVAALNECGDRDIIVVDTLGDLDKWRNLCAKSFRLIVSPEEFLGQLDRGLLRPDIVLHMGAITDTSERDADALYSQNTDYTRRLSVWSLQNEARFIYASSASVYGDGSLGFSDADDLTPRLRQLNAYAFSKWMFDNEAIREGWNDRIVGLRFFNVFGPNEYHKGRMASVIWHAVNQVRDSGRMQLFKSHREDYADGGQKRDFVWVDDVCKVILWTIENRGVSGLFNLGSGSARTFNDLAAAIFAALGLDPSVEFVPTPESIRASYQYLTEADLGKLRSAGYGRSMTSLEQSVAVYVRDYLSKANPYR